MNTSPTGSLLLLPNELLVHIIRMACGSGPKRYYFDTPYRSAQTLQSLAHTCRLLRQLIQDVIDEVEQPVTPRPNIMRDLPLLCEERWVDAAAGNGSPPLIIRADIPEPDTSLARTLNRALSFISRIKTLILRGRDGVFDRYPLHYAPAQSASVLETLRLHNMNVEYLFRLSCLSPELPSLRTVQLSDCLVFMMNPLFRSTNLTTLNLAYVSFGIRGRADDCTPEMFAHMLLPCSGTLRELIVYDEQMFGIDAVPASMTKYEPHPSTIVHFPALKKVSVRALSHELACMFAHLDMPRLCIAKLNPIVGFTPIDCEIIRNILLPRISKSLLRGAETFDTVLVDQDTERVVAMYEGRVLDLTVLCCIPPGGDAEHWERDLTILRRLMPECIRRTTRVHIISECPHEPHIKECQYLLTDVFPEVVALALYGTCAPYILLALHTGQSLEVAPSLRTLSILGAPTFGQWHNHTEIRRVLSIDDPWWMARLSKFHILYDSVMASLLGDVHPADLDDDTQEEMMHMAGIVNSEWEEFAHSHLAEDLAKVDRFNVGAKLKGNPKVLL